VSSKDEHDIGRSADWHRRGQMLDDLLAFLHAWWTTNPVSWDSEFFSLPPVHADLRPVQAGGPHIWTGGASEAAMRRVSSSPFRESAPSPVRADAAHTAAVQPLHRLWRRRRPARLRPGQHLAAIPGALRPTAVPRAAARCREGGMKCRGASACVPVCSSTTSQRV
jgi:hypothetical protein